MISEVAKGFLDHISEKAIASAIAEEEKVAVKVTNDYIAELTETVSYGVAL